jgi:hypothetical protein
MVRPLCGKPFDARSGSASSRRAKREHQHVIKNAQEHGDLKVAHFMGGRLSGLPRSIFPRIMSR